MHSVSVPLTVTKRGSIVTGSSIAPATTSSAATDQMFDCAAGAAIATAKPVNVLVSPTHKAKHKRFKSKPPGARANAGPANVARRQLHRSRCAWTPVYLISVALPQQGRFANTVDHARPRARTHSVL